MELAKSQALKILLADDSLPGLTTVKITLENMGHTCVTTTNGRQALIMAEQHCYDVIFLDEQMPDLHGSTICSQLRNVPGPNQHSRIFSLSGENNVTPLEKISDAGFDELLYKPVTRERLEQCLGDNTNANTSSQLPGVVGKNKLLNESSLRQLTIDLGASTALHLLNLFNSELQSMIDRLACASKNNDKKEILAVAHILKNSASLYGADLLAAESQSLNETTNTDLNSILLAGRLLQLRCSQSQSAVTQYIFLYSIK
jgi:CheY-like chemotaxis protein